MNPSIRSQKAPMKRRVLRTKSLEDACRGFLGVSRRTLTAKQNENETNIFASSMVGEDFILDKLRDLKSKEEVTKVEIEDMIASDVHHSLLPMVKALAVLDERSWEGIKYVDSIDLQNFSPYQQVRKELEADYQSTHLVDGRSLAAVVSFQLQISVDKGTPLPRVQGFLRCLKHEKGLFNFTFPDSIHCRSSSTAKEGPPEVARRLSISVGLRASAGGSAVPEGLSTRMSIDSAIEMVSKAEVVSDIPSPEYQRQLSLDEASTSTASSSEEHPIVTARRHSFRIQRKPNSRRHLRSAPVAARVPHKHQPDSISLVAAVSADITTNKQEKERVTPPRRHSYHRCDKRQCGGKAECEQEETAATTSKKDRRRRKSDSAAVVAMANATALELATDFDDIETTDVETADADAPITTTATAKKDSQGPEYNWVTGTYLEPQNVVAVSA